MSSAKALAHTSAEGKDELEVQQTENISEHVRREQHG
jgi:hypothetical protein